MNKLDEAYKKGFEYGIDQRRIDNHIRSHTPIVTSKLKPTYYDNFKEAEAFHEGYKKGRFSS